MIKKLHTSSLLFLIIVFFSLQISFAETISLRSSYPAPFGSYDMIKLLPTTQSGSCKIGTIYFDTSSGLMSCVDDEDGDDTGVWDQTEGVWSSEETDIFLTDSSNDVKIGIGTNEPKFKLSIDNDGGIFARGDTSNRAFDNQLGGTIFLWYPTKAAFRSGTVTGNHWDDYETE